MTETTSTATTALVRGRAVAEDTDQLFAIAKGLAGSALCPTQYRNKPGDAFAAIISGAEIGFQPMQSLKSIAVINGRASIYGDGLPAVAYASGKLKRFSERFDSDQQGCPVAVVVIERSDVIGEREFRFGQADAVRAGLWGKSGPWSQYPARMLQMRARSYAFRDCFADYLAGLHVAEEQSDIENHHSRPVVVEQNTISFSEMDSEVVDDSSGIKNWIEIIESQLSLDDLEQLVAAEIKRECNKEQIELLESHIESKRKELSQ